MTNIQLFNNPKFGEIRVVEIDGKPFFVANDVASALGYSSPKDAITRHCKGATFHRLTDNQGFIRETKVISQGDIYRLAAKSELPGAEEFESWIFDEILPSINKHGAYMTPETIEKTLLSPDFLIKLATTLKEEQQKRIESENQIMKLKPKAELMDKVLDSEEKIDIGQAAKILNLPYGRNRLFKKLREHGVLFKGRNEPKQEYIDKKYFELKEKWVERNEHDGFAVIKILVTQKGLEFLNKILSGEKTQPTIAKIA